MNKDESLFYHPELAKRFFGKSAEVAKSAKVRIILPEASNGEGRIRSCRRPWQFIKIDPDGSVRFCYKAWNNPIGNIFSDNFFDLWNNPHYQLIRKTVNRQKPYFKYCNICSRRCGYTLESSHIQYLHNDWYNFEQDCRKIKNLE